MYIDLFFTIIIIIWAILILKKKQNKVLLFLKNKKHRVWIVIIAIILIIYSVMLINTNSVMKEVRDAFLWKTDPVVTADKPIDMYNDVSYWDKENLGKVNLLLVRLSAWHNFQDGYIWAWYCYVAYDKKGELITGSWYIPTKWKIHKENRKWEIIEIYEAP